MKGDFVITNDKGLHARAAAAFVNVCSSFDAIVKVSKDDLVVDGHSIMGLMMLGAAKDSSIHVETSGKDQKDVYLAIGKLIDAKFNEN
ncbi:MAG: HPr family phosphocarrier protein [Alphaproteobacteria bacterium]|nr:HPr family phosphocarrier protein [Alphaproteobacteria bacterium]